MRANRISCSLAHGAPEVGQECLHSCDTPACCNPRHLRWGTHAENMQEARDRTGVGGKQKLTKEQAFAIRNSPDTTRTLADKYGISVDQVRNIRRGKQWT